MKITKTALRKIIEVLITVLTSIGAVLGAQAANIV